MDKIKQNLTKITEKYKNNYSNFFDRNGKPDTLRNNVMLVAELQLKLAEELVETTKSYYETEKITEIFELEEFRNDLYMDFINFATTLE